MEKCQVFIVTGVSGSGRSTAIKALEDFGCEVIDNLPVSICLELMSKNPLMRPLALGIDIRTRDFNADAMIGAIKKIGAIDHVDLMVIFLDSSHEVIRKRYRDTRRFHPLGIQGNLDSHIENEKCLLTPIKSLADLVIDSSSLSPPELRKILRESLNFGRSEITIHVMSFAYKNGLPQRADIVFDMRFLPNPYYNDELKFLTGASKSIKEYIGKEKSFQDFISHMSTILLDIALPQWVKESRGEIIVAFGCSGGRHRSVCTAEKIAETLRAAKYHTKLYHREIG